MNWSPSLSRLPDTTAWTTGAMSGENAAPMFSFSLLDSQTGQSRSGMLSARVTSSSP